MKENDNITEEGGYYLSSKTVIAIVILIFYNIATPIFKKLNFHYLHESGICMILGLLCGLIGNIFLHNQSIVKSLTFNDEIFFNFVLPPIIFSAGYNLKKKAFFKYFFYIITFGIFGTLISFGVVSSLIILVNKINLFPLLTVKQILLFASVIASTDTVAALTFIKDDEQPKLFSILFGEGILNDAVCIVLYRIIKNTSFNTSEKFDKWMILSIVYSFLILFTVSTLIGITVGLLCSYILKKLKRFRLNRIQETSMIIFFAFLTYSISESLGYSPILALLFCGIFMSHYAFYNLSFQAREESSIASKIMSNIAEGFVFTYLGLTSITISHETFSLIFISFVFVFCCLGRFVSIYGISFILKLIRCPMFRFSYNEQSIMFFAGCIRGAIAFGLAISIPEMGDKKIKQLLLSSTLVLVFFSTIVFGALMASIVKFFTSENKILLDKEEEAIEKFSLTGYEETEMGNIIPGQEGIAQRKGSDGDEGDSTAKKISHKIKGFWHKIDDNYLRPFFIDDWPDVKREHNQIAKEIIGVFEEYQKNKMKKKIMNNFFQENQSGKISISSTSTDSTIRSSNYTTKNESLLFKN